MTSPGLLLLLLVSSSFFLSSVCAEGKKNQAMGIVWKTIETMKSDVVPLLRLIPVNGPLISAVANLALGIALKAKRDKALMNAVKSGFKNLNSKIDEYHNEQKFIIWKSAAHKPELNIKVAWSEYETLLKSLEGKSDDQKKRLTEEFSKNYKVLATKKLHTYLTTEGVSLIDKMGEMIQGYVKCHEEDIRAYAVLINTLIYKGITMNHFYYEINNLTDSNRIEESAKIAYESASAMFNIQKACILNTAYIKEEVEKLIKSNDKRAELAHTVRNFLAKTYDRYDWMVVAYLAGHSDYTTFKFLNKHTLTGFFLKVKKDKVEVAIARQVKGKHTKADKVKRAIERCRTQTIDCHQVAEKLTKCAEKVDNIKVSLTYTALHAYIDKAHQSVDAKDTLAEVLANPVDNTVPYMYTGICKKHKVPKFFNMGGRFTVLIKSDEEMTKQDPCSGLNCGKGKCVRVEGTFVAMCECEKWFYGKNCEHKIDEFKKDLMKKD